LDWVTGTLTAIVMYALLHNKVWGIYLGIVNQVAWMYINLRYGLYGCIPVTLIILGQYLYFIYRRNRDGIDAR
jgi:nicotinamide riboside transporter PnuC